MITVEIKINGRTIYKRSAKQSGMPLRDMGKHMRVYQTDDGQEILHNRKRGAIRLAIKMLRGLRELDDEYQREHPNPTDTDLRNR